MWFVAGSFVQQRAIQSLSNYSAGFSSALAETGDVQGIITQFPGYRFSNNQYIVTLVDTAQGQEATRLLVYTEPYQKFVYSEQVHVSGNRVDVRDQGEEWQRYYQKLGVHYVMFRGTVSGVSPPRPQTFFETIKLNLFYIKMFLRNEIAQKFSSHTSALVLGMLLGEKDELSKTEKDMFNYVGLSHILVVSGYNISLLISFIFIVLKAANKHVRIALSLVLIFLFTILVGGDGSVVRAAVMGSILIFSKITHRPSSALNVLFCAVTLMLAVHPFSIFDAGLHLSFIATFSLLILPSIKKIPEFILTSAWVFTFVAPYIAYLSGFMSFAGVVSNCAVVLLLPMFMLVSLVALVGLITNIQLWIDMILLDVMSRYIFMIAHLTHTIPRIEIKISPMMTVCIYATIFCVIVYAKNRHTTREFIEKRYQKPLRQNSSQFET